jgi:hypothetical protein
MQIDDAIREIIEFVRLGAEASPGYSSYGYELYLPNVLYRVVQNSGTNIRTC